MQTELFDHGISKQVRNLSHKQTMENPYTDIQRRIVEREILAHPAGVTDAEICVLTGISKSSVTARRNEIPSVIPVGIAKVKGENGDRLNTMWGINSYDK